MMPLSKQTRVKGRKSQLSNQWTHFFRSTMDSDAPAVGSAVSLDATEDQTEGNHDSCCVTDPASPESDLSTALKGSEEKQERVDVCQFFLKGKCHFGQRCRLSHSLSAVQNTEEALSDHESSEDDQKAKNKKKKGKVTKSTKPKAAHGEEMTKKPRMRTADEVISRVLWDPTVEGSEFVVGYVDRFLGVLERPFSDFNWDVDPCDCNYTTELALPRHRILYFSFRGHRVWDRHSRVDRVFGSTGHPLAPPFGAGEEVEGVNSQETGQHEPLESEPLELSEVHISDDSGKQGGESKDSACDEDKHGDINISTPDSTQQKPNDTGSSSQDQQETGRKGSIGSQPSTEQESHDEVKGETGEEKSAEEWKESGEEDSEELHQDLNVSLEQREKAAGGGRPPKRRPTHFITFRANTPSILSSFQRLQEELTSLLPSSAPHWMASSTLHVTLCLLVLHGPAEVAAAGEILRRVAFLDRNPPVAVTFPVKLKHFSGKVLYLSPQPQLQLQQLNSGLQEAYRKEGLLHRDSYNPRYHLTLAKVEDREGERVFEGVGDLKVGKGLNFGRLPVNTLHLCSMGMSKVDGFYDILCTVTLR